MKKEYHSNQGFTNILGIIKEFNLTETDIKNRGQSFVNKETLEMAAIRRVSDQRGHQILDIQTRKKGVQYSGIVIPYWDIHTGKNIVGFNLRRDKADVKENSKGKTKEVKKYVKPRGTRNLLYLPPMMPRELLNRTDVVIAIFEGEFKALAAARVASEDFTLSDWHFIPLAISGVDNFKTKQIQVEDDEEIAKSVGLPEFDYFKWVGVKVVIVYDSDIDSNRNVKAARYRLKNFLQEKGAKVFFADLPKEFEGNPTKGFDDYVGAVAAKYGDVEAIKAGLEIVHNALSLKTQGIQIAQNYRLIEACKTDANFPIPGVWFDDGEERFYICSLLRILAETQTTAGENYGRSLEWTDSKNRVHRYAMPIELIHGDNTEFIKYLVSRGLMVGTTRKHYEHLRTYINLSTPDKTIISTEKIGWNDGAFVLPDETFGGSDEITFQSENACLDKFQKKGTISEWRENVGKYCAGNPLLAFAVSASFAAPLLPITEVPGGGFHFRGTTSSGKTTLLLAAGSVCGGSDDMHGFCHTWKSTANGLEILATSHNHLPLILDEIGECNPREVGNIAYMLANGHGKNRMARNISRRKAYSWHLLFLSSGERRLSDIMLEVGQKIRGGQEIRLCDIETNNHNYGLFDNLHEFRDGREFSDYLRENSRKFYGTAIRHFLRETVEMEREIIKENWRKFEEKFLAEVIKEPVQGEVLRVASRHALIGFAGEMATGFGTTGWQQGEAFLAACEVFRIWHDGWRGNGSSDAENVIRQVRYFLEKHGQSRFQDVQDPYAIVSNRAGFRRTISSRNTIQTQFLIFPETFRTEVAAGYDEKFFAKALKQRGYLVPGGDGKSTRNERIMGKQQRFYVISDDIFSVEEKYKAVGV